MEVFDGHGPAVREIAQVDRPEPAVAYLAVRVKPVCRRLKLFVGEDRRERGRRRTVAAEVVHCRVFSSRR